MQSRIILLFASPVCLYFILQLLDIAGQTIFLVNYSSSAPKSYIITAEDTMHEGIHRNFQL